jgi:hypothetical protein
MSRLRRTASELGLEATPYVVQEERKMGHYLWAGAGFEHRVVEEFSVAAYCAKVGTMRVGPRFTWEEAGEDELFLSDLDDQKLPSWLVVDPRRRDFLVVPTFVEPANFSRALRGPLVELALSNGASSEDVTIAAPFSWVIRDFDRALKRINEKLVRAEKVSRASFAGVSAEENAWVTLKTRFQPAYEELAADPHHDVLQLLLYGLVFWGQNQPDESMEIEDDTDLTEIVPDNSYGWTFFTPSSRDPAPLLTALDDAVSRGARAAGRNLLREAAAVVQPLGDPALDARLYLASAELALRGGDRLRARADVGWAEHRGVHKGAELARLDELRARALSR